MNRAVPRARWANRRGVGAGDHRGFSPARCGRGGWYARELSTVIVDKPRPTEHGGQPEREVKRRGGVRENEQCQFPVWSRIFILLRRRPGTRAVVRFCRGPGRGVMRS